MNKIILSSFVLLLAGCSSTNWFVRNYQDEFTDQRSCRVTYGTDFGKGFVKGMGGIHYYPFIERDSDGVIFGIYNDYNIPVGDVQIRVDGNDYIEISTSETPLRFSSNKYKVDMSYMENVEGLDQEALQNSMDTAMKNVQKISSPYIAAAGDKASQIISQLRNGNTLKMRIIGFGANSVASTTGEYNLGEDFRQGLSKCGI